MRASCGIGAALQLGSTGYDAGGNQVAFSGDVTYSSSNEEVVSVSSTGLMTMANLGIATVTATSGGMTASMLVTVKNQTIANLERQSATNSHSADIVRTGSYSYKFQGGTDTSFSDAQYAKINPILNEAGTIPANAVIDVWFYDNGQSTDSEAGVYMSPYNLANGARAVGILDASDTTYKVTERGVRLSQTNNQWNQGDKYGVSENVMGTPIDTGIQRTKGWHQVVYVSTNLNASQTMQDIGTNNIPKSTDYTIYLDGQSVYSETTNLTFVFLYGYAGFNSSNYAYIADPVVSQYIEVTDVSLSEASGTYTVNYSNYYGKAGDQTIRYNWQVSDNGETGWTDIPGATSLTTASYTPSASYAGKYIRGGVRVIAGGVYPNYYYDKAYLWDGETVNSLSLGKNTCYYTKGASNQQLSLVGYAPDMSEHIITNLPGVAFQSSDESVVTVTDAGVLTAVDYGIATVTATYGGKTASMLITVTNNTISAAEGGAAPDSHSTDLVRCGAYSYKLQGGTDTSFSDGTYAKINSLVHPWNTIPANAVINAWFYDNGESADSEAGIYMSPYSNNTNGTRVVGILSAADTTYKVSQNGARLSLTNNNWNEGNKYGVRGDTIGTATNTGIQRTKGWHQVSFVRKNADASATMTDKGSVFPKSTVYKIYLDGQEVYTETADRAFVYLYGYAGYNASNYAYIADPTIHQYISVDDVTLTESGNTFTANYNYYGTTGTKTPSYKWQVSSNGATGWTDIVGATGSTYTPDVNDRNKFIRAAVSLSAPQTIGWRASDAEVPNLSLIRATIEANTVSVELKIANDTASAIPYALLVGYYDSTGALIGVDFDRNEVAAGASKTSHTFTVPQEVRGSFTNALVFLWRDIVSLTPYAGYINVQ